VIRSRLTFANVIAMLALCLSYAATALPRGSVGTHELARKAVTGSKLAARSVHKRNLSKKLRRQIAAKRQGPAGPQGEPGPQGATGPQGDAGPGATRIHFLAPAEEAPEPQTVLEEGGFRIRATCLEGEEEPGEVQIGIYLYSSGGGTIALSVVDSESEGEGGEGEGSGPRANVFRAALPAGEELGPVGPSAGEELDRWSLVSGLYLGDDGSTINLEMLVEADSKSGRCTLEGTAIPAS
jgi:hypothetical protein